MKKQSWSGTFGFLFVWLFVLFFYVRTMAASVSFWDCGEFIACAHMLGIPHPPGAPLHGLLGRLFSLLPVFGTVARRVNFLSALSGALAAGMLYLVVERVSRSWFAEGLGWRGRWLALVGGITAGLWMAFSDTFWSNTVEAEVYAPAMFLMVLATWLILKWQEVREHRGGDHLLLAVIYLLFLGIGVHQTAFLVAPGVFLLVVLVDEQRLRDWRFWLVWVPFAVVVVTIADQFMMLLGLALAATFLGMTLSTQGRHRKDLLWWFLGLEFPVIYLFWTGKVEFSWMMFLVVQGWLFVLWIFELRSEGGEESRRRWRFCFWLVFCAVAGYSIQAFIPVRSLLDPIIDENNPDSWARFMMYLKRLQYGQTGMLEGMFHRKGSWGSQFGAHPRMGYWGFFRQGWAPVRWWPLVVGVGLLGMVVGWFRERRRWWYLMVLMVICSLVVVLWMNFSDGTRGVQLEVRDRDYFFTPTYLAFSLWMGLGVSGLLWLVVRRVRGAAGGVIFMVLSVVLLLGPMGTLGYNYHRHDRSANWIAHDYAYNLLGSCDRDGLLFTNGDNDTFPLWYIQEVEGYRKDVRVVNLSLLNTGWYIKQLNDVEPRVPTGYTDEQANTLTPMRWPEDREVDLGGFTLPLKSGQILRIQDRAMLNIIRVNRWKRPVYIAITVSPENKLGLDSHLKMESMALRLVREEGPNMIDLERSRDLIMKQHIFRGLNDETIYKDENTIKLLTNYAASFAAVGQAYCNLEQFAEAKEVLQKGVEVLYPFWGIYQVLARAHEGSGDADKAIEAGERGISVASEDERPMIYASLLPIYQRNDMVPDLLSFIDKRIMKNPEEFSAYWALFRMNHTLGNMQEAAAALEKWLNVHPEDERTRQFLTDYRQRMISAPEQTGEQG